MRGGGRVTLEQVSYDPVAWGAIVDNHPDGEVFHGPAWLAYLAESQGAEPIVATVRQDGQLVGHFVGGIVRRYGVTILGSPMSGWGTPRLGFLAEEGLDRQDAAIALLDFAFRDLGCLHVELGDVHLSPALMAGTGYEAEVGRTFLVDLDGPEEAILARMKQTTRTYIRKGPRTGLVAERGFDESFAGEYYEQLQDVFAHQELVPTYSLERVKTLIRHLAPTGEVMLLRVLAPDGESIATAVTVGRQRRATLWGAAFKRTHGSLHPNEVLHWEVIRYWRSRGFTIYDMGGGGDYKAKYGGVEVPSIRFHRSRFALMRYGRTGVRNLVRARQVAAGRRKPRAGGGDP